MSLLASLIYVLVLYLQCRVVSMVFEISPMTLIYPFGTGPGLASYSSFVCHLECLCFVILSVSEGSRTPMREILRWRSE